MPSSHRYLVHPIAIAVAGQLSGCWIILSLHIRAWRYICVRRIRATYLSLAWGSIIAAYTNWNSKAMFRKACSIRKSYADLDWRFTESGVSALDMCRLVWSSQRVLVPSIAFTFMSAIWMLHHLVATHLCMILEYVRSEPLHIFGMRIICSRRHLHPVL